MPFGGNELVPIPWVPFLFNVVIGLLHQSCSCHLLQQLIIITLCTVYCLGSIIPQFLPVSILYTFCVLSILLLSFPQLPIGSVTLILSQNFFHLFFYLLVFLSFLLSTFLSSHCQSPPGAVSSLHLPSYSLYFTSSSPFHSLP